MTFPFAPAATLHHGLMTGDSRSLPLSVRTAPAPGAYAVTIARAAGPFDDGGALVGIHVTLHVTRGRIGVGCLDAGETTFLDEVHVDAGPSPVIVPLLGGRSAETGPLVIRNVSPHGASLVTLVALGVVAVPAAGDTWPAPLSRPPAISGWGRAYANHCTDLPGKARLRRLDGLTAPFTLAWSDGLRMQIVPDDRLSRVIYLSGTYEPRTLRVLRAAVSEGDVVLDVGANAGVVALSAADWVGSAGRVIAIEPSAREFARLQGHVALNGLRQVTAIRAAAAATAGSRQLQVAAAPHVGLNTLGDRFAYEGIARAGVETIDAVTLDGLAAGAGLARIRAIKLDVEGAEVEALAGAATILRTQQPLVLFEICTRALEASGTTADALETLLRDAGYVWFEIEDATGELRPGASLAEGPDRNVAAVPRGHADALVDAVRRLD